MDTVTILRDLWRARWVVLVVWLVALLAGTAVLYKISWPFTLETRKYEVGVATTSILIDTPSSQVVEIAPKGSDTLGVRANLIASLMVDGTLKATIARNAGLDPDDLVGISSTAVAQGAVPEAHDRHAPVLTTRVVTDNDGSELPIIQIEAQAGDATAAARLASAALGGLKEYLDSKAAAQRITNAERLQVSGLGASQAQTVARGPKDAFGLAAVIFVFGFGCAGILAALALARAWRTATEREHGRPSPTPPPVDLRPDVVDGDSREDRSGETWASPPWRPSLVVSRPRQAADSGEERRTGTA
jgi:hypothetical protein